MGIVRDAEGRRFDERPHHCPVCGPGPTKILGERGGRHHRYGRGVVSTIVQCCSCSLLFPDPFPHALDPQDMYGDPDKYFALHEDVESKAERRREVIADARRLTGTPDPALLEIGSGRGDVLLAAQREGLSRVVGLDFSDAMIASAAERGLVVHKESVEQHAGKTSHPYDVVVMIAVLEHVTDPDSFVASVRTLLRPGGVAFVDVPNEPNLFTRVGRLAARARRSPAVLNLSPTFPPYHVYGFSANALERLLSKHGMAIEESLLWGRPTVPAAGGLGDRARAIGATQLNRLGNLIRQPTNMTVWARRT